MLTDHGQRILGVLETGIEDLGRIEDLEDVEILATGSQGLEGIIEDLDDLGDM